MLITPWLPTQFGPDPLLVLLAALLVDAIVGDPDWLWRRLPHPVALIGGIIGLADRKMNRENRSALARWQRGALLVALLVPAMAALGYAVSVLARLVPWGWTVELVLAWSLLAQQSLYVHVRRVAVGLENAGLTGGRQAVSMIVGRDPASLDEHGVARAAIESLAENFGDGVVAPVVWYLLFGLPGLLAYKTINTLDSMIGHRTARHLNFGATAARLDDAANWIPARLAGLLIVAAAVFAPLARPGRALRIMGRDHGHHRSPNSGWPEAAMAGALDLALAGPRRYPGYVAEEKWIGDGSARATPHHIRRALSLYVVACLLTACLVGAIAYIRVIL